MVHIYDLPEGIPDIGHNEIFRERHKTVVKIFLRGFLFPKGLFGGNGRRVNRSVSLQSGLQERFVDYFQTVVPHQPCVAME